MSGERKDGKPEKRGWNQAWRFLAIGLFACLLVVPPKPAHAFGFCDLCVVAAIGVLDGDTTALLADIDVNLVIADTLLGTADVLLTTIEATLLDPLWGLPAIEFALYGDFPPLDPAQGDFGIDIDMVGGFAAVLEAIDMHATEAAPMAADEGADSKKLYGDLQGQADMAPDAYVSQTTLHCATTYAMSTRSIMEDFVRALTLLTEDQIRDRDTGAGSNTGANVFAQTVCEMAPFRIGSGTASPRLSPQIVAALSNCPNITGAPNDLVDADIDMGSVFDRMQYSFPTDLPTWTSNNHIIFTPENESEWQYVAAWRYCEHLVPNMPPPPNGQNSSGIASLNDLQRINDDARASVFKLPALKECMRAVAERTACSAGGANNPAVTINNNANTSCWQLQDIACHRLTDPPPSGLGLQDVGNEEVNYALQNCDNNGLSLRAFDYAWAHRCNDPNYASVSLIQEYAKSDNVRDESKWCQEDVKAFEAKGEMDEDNFLTSVQIILQGGGTNVAPNPAAQSSFPNS